MTDYAKQWNRFRRLRRLTFVPLVACFAFAAVMIGSSFDERRHPVMFHVAGSLDVLCFLIFCYNGSRLSRFRCPKCDKYFISGKNSQSKRDGPIVRCRHCGLRLYAEI